MIRGRVEHMLARMTGGRGWLVLVSLIVCLAGTSVFQASALGNNMVDAADAVIGTWQGIIPGGPRAATIMIVRNGDGLAGTFMGYDYDRPVAGQDGKPLDGPTPKVTRRTGLMLIDPKFNGKTLSFKLKLPSRDGGTREADAEMTLADPDNAEMKVTMPGNRPPLVIKMTRE
ncbi:MAG TPA: hypothetical protein VGO91_19910 [Pyrinomonadaceae bacterium]|jgi:hypothetical protein|nr:hypothetical protein [Pyrinomonadaceae bacterium]